MDTPSKAVSITVIHLFLVKINVLLVFLLKYFRCRYPSILVIYQTIPAIVLALLILVGVCAQKDLFCSSKDLFETFSKPTPFCTISGEVWN